MREPRPARPVYRKKRFLVPVGLLLIALGAFAAVTYLAKKAEERRQIVLAELARFDAYLEAQEAKYLTIPLLTDRQRALLRRSSGVASPTLRAGEVEMDPATREVRHRGESVTLTPKEYALLEYLLRNVNRPLSRATLMEHVWGIRFDPGRMWWTCSSTRCATSWTPSGS